MGEWKIGLSPLSIGCSEITAHLSTASVRKVNIKIKIHSKVLMLYRLDKKEYNVLLISVHVSPILSQLYDIFLNFGLFLGFFILEKLS